LSSAETTTLAALSILAVVPWAYRLFLSYLLPSSQKSQVSTVCVAFAEKIYYKKQFFVLLSTILTI
jgi:hypothetical protein